MSTPVPAKWDAALREFQGVLESRRRTPETVRRMVRQVRRFAVDAGPASPWDTTHRQVDGWLDGLDCTPLVCYGYRSSLRAFYGWAVDAGRMDTNPTVDGGGRLVKHEPPPGWGQPVRDFRRYLRAAGRPATTVQARTDQLVNAARTIGVPSPWDVTPDDLIGWLGTRGWSNETARSRRAALRSFYAWAMTAGHTTTNPALSLPSVRPTPPMPRPAPDTAIRDALQAAGPRERLMIRLAAEVGLRRAEIAALHTGDVQRDAYGWVLWVRGKGQKVRRLPIPADLAQELRQRGDGWVFPGRAEGHLSPRWVGKVVGGLLPGELTAHTLRHRFATETYAIDHDILAVQQLLGHASPNTTQRYVALPAEDLRRLVSRVAIGA